MMFANGSGGRAFGRGRPPCDHHPAAFVRNCIDFEARSLEQVRRGITAVALFNRSGEPVVEIASEAKWSPPMSKRESGHQSPEARQRPEKDVGNGEQKIDDGRCDPAESEKELRWKTRGQNAAA